MDIEKKEEIMMCFVVLFVVLFRLSAITATGGINYIFVEYTNFSRTSPQTIYEQDIFYCSQVGTMQLPPIIRLVHRKLAPTFQVAQQKKKIHMTS